MLNPPPPDTLRALINTVIQSGKDAVLVDDDGTLSAETFLRRISMRKQQLQDHGIIEQDRVVVCTGRGRNFWIDLVAVWTAGAIVVPVNPDSESKWLEFIHSKIEPAAILESDLQFSKESVTSSIPELDFDTAKYSGPINLPELSANKTAAILFTSGSTGAPKGVVLSYRSVFGNAIGILKHLYMSDRDRLFISIPYNFTSAICHFLAAMLRGATLISTERRLFKADLFALIKERQATCFGGSPVQLRWIAECAESDTIKLNWVMSSGDHLSVETISALKRLLPNTKISTVYGLTELGGRFCILPDELISTDAGSVGRPISGLDYTIVDEDGFPVAEGESGEVCVSGNLLFDGYYHDKERTAAAMGSLGFMTGDIGYRDLKGLLRLEGRRDDVFKVSGQKVSGVAIANTLLSLGWFDDVAVLPVPHEVISFVPHAFYVLKPGKVFDRRTAIAAIRSELAPNSVPSGFTELDSISRTASGKVQRDNLLVQLEAKNG
jgi:acyl-CoA synthetase (AMP-forming)/AMP-acid ligase II